MKNDEPHIRVANNYLHPVTPFDYAYTQLILDMINHGDDRFRMSLHLEWLRYRAKAGDEELQLALSEIEHHIESKNYIDLFRNRLDEQISRIQNSEIKEAFRMLALYASKNNERLFASLSELAESFDPEYRAYTDDSPEPEHSLIQNITRRCGLLDSYQSKTVHRAIRFFSGKNSTPLYQQMLRIVKALPLYRGHARV